MTTFVLRRLAPLLVLLLGVAVLCFTIAHEPETITNTERVYVGPGADVVNGQELIGELQIAITLASCKTDALVSIGYEKSDSPLTVANKANISSARENLDRAKKVVGDIDTAYEVPALVKAGLGYTDSVSDGHRGVSLHC